MSLFAKIRRYTWIGAVKDLARTLDGRSMDWHQNLPQALVSALYDRLWQEIGSKTMRWAPSDHRVAKNACAVSLVMLASLQ
jgi:hypothetical protein